MIQSVTTSSALAASSSPLTGQKVSTRITFSDEEANRELAVSEAEGWHYLDGESTALHVWVHRGNPAGVFHDANPTID
jgi:hypothetical protein